MSLITLSDSTGDVYDVIQGRIHMPIRGVWWSELKLDTPTPPTGQITVKAANGLSLVGNIVKGGIFLNSAFVRIYGGNGDLSVLITPASYQNSTVNDPLTAILNTASVTASSTISSAITSTQLLYWTILSKPAANCIEDLAGAAGKALHQIINWRVLSDGSVWLGQETWPTQSLPTTSDVLSVAPVGPRYDIGCATPTLMPGVFLTDINANVFGVDHWLSSSAIRTWAWAS
jgi:hypothetical protein